MRKSNIRQEIKEHKNYLIGISVFTFLFLFFCSKLSPLYPTNDWSDVNIYFTIGKSIFQGKVPYTDAFDHKGPFIFFIYGLSSLISSTTFIGTFVIYLFLWITALCACYLLTIKALNNNRGISALTIILLFPLIGGKMGYGGSPEELIFCLILLSSCLFSYYFIYRSSEQNYLKDAFFYGVASAIVIFTKINLSAFFIPLLIGLFIHLLALKQYHNLRKNIVAYLLGLMVIALPISIYFYSNGALPDAFSIYITLNKDLSAGSFSPANSFISVGWANLSNQLKTSPITSLFIILGALVFPIVFIKNIIGKISFITSAIFLFASIYLSSIFHFYYPIPTFAFIPLGLIVVFKCVLYIYNIERHRLAIFALFGLLILFPIYKVRFFGLSLNEIMRRENPITASYRFSNIISKEKDPTLLLITYEDVTNLYTLCSIVPNVRYFSALNLPFSKFPDLRNEQTRYIEEKTVQFIVARNNSPQLYNYFNKLPAFKNNYTLIDTYIEHRFEEEYYLYKRND